MNSWTQPEGGPLILDGLQFTGGYPVSAEPVRGRAHLLEMDDGSMVTQVPFYASDRSTLPAYYVFTWEQDIRHEVEWRKLNSIRAAGAAVYFTPMLTDTETFVLGDGINTKTLTRPRALGTEAGFSSATYPDAATINGTAVTILATGTPSASQITIEGKDITTASQSAGDVLEVVYYPSFWVNPPVLGFRDLGWNNKRRSVILQEGGAP